MHNNKAAGAKMGWNSRSYWSDTERNRSLLPSRFPAAII